MKKLLFLLLTLALPFSLDGGVSGVTATPRTPIFVFIKSLANVTTGAPVDLGTITVPAGITRYRVTGTTAVSSSSTIVTETQTGSPAAGTVEARDASGGLGTVIMTATAPNGGAGSSAIWVASSGNTVFTSSTITIRQTVNSASAATLSFYITIIPLP